MSKHLDFEQLVGLCRRAHQETQRSSAHAVDRYLVTRNWLFGWYIVEYEQNGADRAKYGAVLIKRLADKLTVRGCSSRSLALSRRFYRSYAGILQTPSAKYPWTPVAQHSHARRPTSGSPVASDELPTVGILLCDRKNDAVVELTLPEGANIYASKYQLYLPSKQDLAAQLASVRRELEGRGGTNE